VNSRPGVRLGVDVGQARVGVARSDPDALLAFPHQTYRREDALAGISEAVTKYSVIEVIVGLPLGMSGGDTASTRDARQFAEELHTITPCPVRLVDERLTTVSAMAGLHQAGRSAKSAKPIIDEASAVIILQHCLDAEKTHGQAPGLVVGEDVND
jgi:putative holliday junction resolvase